MGKLSDALTLDERGYGYPSSPGWKEPTTSRDAANVIKRTASNLRELALNAIVASGPTGLTPDEVALTLGRTVLAVRPRITELLKANKVERTGAWRRNSSGMNAAVFRAKVQSWIR